MTREPEKAVLCRSCDRFTPIANQVVEVRLELCPGCGRWTSLMQETRDAFLCLPCRRGTNPHEFATVFGVDEKGTFIAYDGFAYTFDRNRKGALLSLEAERARRKEEVNR